ncbi:hypothetical protein AAIG33_26125 [Phytobacter ursingii]|uniref:hypothetical protein n=1 Tax=Phytobacter ursingii TaxID=1972431 RepID=UPI0031B78715
MALYVGGVGTECFGYVGGGFQDLRSAWGHDHASHWKSRQTGRVTVRPSAVLRLTWWMPRRFMMTARARPCWVMVP